MKERKRNSSRPLSAEKSNSAVKGAAPPKRPSRGNNNATRKGAVLRALLVTAALCAVATTAYYVAWPGRSIFTSRASKPRAVTPLPAARVQDLKQFQGEHRERLFWGTYRPHLYLGIRSRTPKSLLAGLMWIGAKDGRYALRHTCEEGDKLSRYAWLRHDGATYGRQELLDQGLLISTSFLKSKERGSGYGGDWAVRIRVEEDGARSNNTDKGENSGKMASVLFYLADEAGRTLTLWPAGSSKTKDAPFAGGVRDEIGGWQLYAKRQDGVAMNYVGLRHVQMESLATPILSILQTQARTKGTLQLPDNSAKDSNVAVIQFTGTAPFELDIVFVSGVDGKLARLESRADNFMGAALSKKLAEKEQEFENRFQDTFKLHEKADSEKEAEVGKVALSNMLGGIGYFYGRSRVDIPQESKEAEADGPSYWQYWPAELFSAVPSRSFFPRGFLWDEGFHQLIISQWDQSISFDIIGHWLDLMNIDGWIPREQILGPEAQSKVPEEFVTQYTSNANPPALFLVLNRLALNYKSDQGKGQAKEEELQLFKTIFPRLKVWFNWFNTTQIGKEPGTYFWHGRDSHTDRELNPKTLTAGLDDYPRASHPSDDERHLDLWCWMALAAKTMTLIAGIAGEPHENYEATARSLTNLTRLNEMHYDYDSGRYYDYGNHTEKVKLRWQEVQDPSTGFVQRVLRRAVLKRPKLGWVPHFGYVSFFPLAMRIIPHDSPIFGHYLSMLHSHQLLWTDYGLRSLSADSSIYMKRNTEHDAPYWRGPVWISLNYLILSALHEYSTVDGPYKSTAALIYSQLRQNLVRNIVDNYYESGYLWENYNIVAKGKGQGSHPFTGWTSLVLLIMAENY